MATNIIPKLDVTLGQPKNVASYTLGAVFASGITAAALNYNSYKKGEMRKQQAINNAIKLSIQGGIATGAAVTAGNNVGQKKFMSALTAISIGLTGVYAVEKLAENLQMRRPMPAEEVGKEIESEEE